MILDFLDANIPLTLTMFIKAFIFFSLLMVGSYFLIACLFYKFFCIKENSDIIKIQTKKISSKQFKREIFQSVKADIFHAFLVCLTILAWRAGWFPKFYLDSGELGWLYFFASIIIFIVFQDILFYIVHITLHTRLFSRFHKIHHQSTLPSPFLLHTFHPLEAFLHYLRIPLFMLLFPLSPIALIIGEFISALNNAYGHLNHEPKLPKFMRSLQRKGIISTSLFHNIHHEEGHGNYGLYFQICDRLFKTVNPLTKEKTKILFEKIDQQVK